MLVSQEDQEMSRRLVEMWTQFADTGHPGHPWTPAHTADDDQYFVIDNGAMKMSSIGEVVNRFKHWS